MTVWLNFLTCFQICVWLWSDLCELTDITIPVIQLRGMRTYQSSSQWRGEIRRTVTLWLQSSLCSHCFPALSKYLNVALNQDNQWDVGKDFLGELFLCTGGKTETREAGLVVCCENSLSHLKVCTIGQTYQMLNWKTWVGWHNTEHQPVWGNMDMPTCSLMPGLHLPFPLPCGFYNKGTYCYPWKICRKYLEMLILKRLWTPFPQTALSSHSYPSKILAWIFVLENRPSKTQLGKHCNWRIKSCEIMINPMKFMQTLKL